MKKEKIAPEVKELLIKKFRELKAQGWHFYINADYYYNVVCKED